MKKIVIIVSCTFTLFSWGQGVAIQTESTKNDKFLIASLPKNGDKNNHKLKIKIFGGGWRNDNLGTNTYSISTRYDNLSTELVKIVKEQTGGDVSRYQLRVYESSNSYDFVMITTQEWLSVMVHVWLAERKNGESISPLTSKNIIKYTGNGTDITNTNKVQLLEIITTNNKGYVGIGTSNPQNRLDVVGTIRATEVKVETGWADFVFDEDYKLRSLEEVKVHIDEHKHLPDIPSEKEVKENGIGLGEMQAKLLQKIEELTLYVIKQDKEIQDLKTELKEIKRK